MRNIIIGAGRLGLELTQFLSKAGHEVILIDRDKALCDEIAADLDALVVCAEGTKVVSLKDAEVDKADNFVAVTGSEETNLMSCLLAKKLGAKRTIARVADPANEEIFKSLEIDVVVNPEEAAASYVEKIILRPGVLDLVDLGRGGAEILEMEIPETAPVVGRKVGEVNSSEYVIIAVLEEATIRIPAPDVDIRAGMRILVLCLTTSIPRLEKDFNRKVRAEKT